MLLERNDSTTKDMPPPYIEVQPPPKSPISESHPIREKGLPPSPPPSSPPPSASTSQLPSPTLRNRNSYLSSTRPISVDVLNQALDRGKGKIFYGKKQTAKDVRAAVLKVVNENVRIHGNHLVENPEPIESVLSNCATSCASASLALSSVIQEASMEQHAPIYWAILARADDDDRHLPSTLISSILWHSSPLEANSRMEIRTACLLTNNQPLFQFIRSLDLYSPPVPVDGLVRGEADLPDSIVVQENSLSTFTADIGVLKFMRRMQHLHEVELEFIARARLWRLYFSSDPKAKDGIGSWKVSLSLLERSPPTYVDAELHIYDASPYPVIPSNSAPSGSSSKPLPDAVISLTSQLQLVASDIKPQRGQRRDITVSLDDNTKFVSARELCSMYIAADETLRVPDSFRT